MNEVYVVSAVRTAIGTFGGSLKDIPPAEIGHVVFGQVVQTEPRDMYVSRVAAVDAGIPVETPALTVNRLCGTQLTRHHTFRRHTLGAARLGPFKYCGDPLPSADAHCYQRVALAGSGPSTGLAGSHCRRWLGYSRRCVRLSPAEGRSSFLREQIAELLAVGNDSPAVLQLHETAPVPVSEATIDVLAGGDTTW